MDREAQATADETGKYPEQQDQRTLRVEVIMLDGDVDPVGQIGQTIDGQLLGNNDETDRKASPDEALDRTLEKERNANEPIRCTHESHDLDLFASGIDGHVDGVRDQGDGRNSECERE